jgi:hypothetical protein
MENARPVAFEELSEGLPWIRQSPADGGVLKAITIRPAENERVSLESCDLSPEWGVHGDGRARGLPAVSR